MPLRTEVAVHVKVGDGLAPAAIVWILPVHDEAESFKGGSGRPAGVSHDASMTMAAG